LNTEKGYIGGRCGGKTHRRGGRGKAVGFGAKGRLPPYYYYILNIKNEYFIPPIFS